MIPAHDTEFQDAARHARPYCLPQFAIGRYQRKNGPVLDIVNVSSLTHSGRPGIATEE